MPTDKQYRPKNPISFKLSLNEEQKKAKASIITNCVTVLTGSWGSGKTLLATQCALDALFSKQVDRIVIGRPAIAEEEIGFLKGSLDDKMKPWMKPIYDNMVRLYDKQKIDKEIANGNIEIMPFAFMQGITFTNSFVVIDEVQNVSKRQLGLVLSRLGKGSTMVLTGDSLQNFVGNVSSMGTLLQIADNVDSVIHVNLTSNHRNPIVEKIIPYFI